MPDAELSVQCQPDGDDWRCEVVVGDDPDATRHLVEVPHECVEQLAPGAETPDELVESSFRFLLGREPRESIMSRFELPVIARYFPEWEAEMERRLGA